MPEYELVRENLRQADRDLKSVRDSWNEVMDRMERAYNQFGNPSHEDLKLEERLYTQLGTAKTRQDEARDEWRTVLKTRRPR